MDHDPQAHRQSQGKPNQIARGLVYGGKRFTLWGLLTRTVTATSAPINSARKTMANIRRPIGTVATGVPVANRSSCDGLVLTLSTWCLPCARRERPKFLCHCLPGSTG